MPQIQVWINKDDPANVEKLVKTLNDAMAENKDKKLKAFVMFLDADGKTLEPKLTALADSAKAQEVCLTTISPKDEAIADYKINLDPSVKNTILVYKRKTITANHVNLVLDEKGLAALKTSIAELVK